MYWCFTVYYNHKEALKSMKLCLLFLSSYCEHKITSQQHFLQNRK